GFQTSQGPRVLRKSRQAADDVIYVLLRSTIDNSKSRSFVKTGDEQKSSREPAPEPFRMAKIRSAHANDRPRVVGLVESAILFGENFEAGVTQSLLGSGIDERAKQRKCVPWGT